MSWLRGWHATTASCTSDHRLLSRLLLLFLSRDRCLDLSFRSSPRLPPRLSLSLLLSLFSRLFSLRPRLSLLLSLLPRLRSLLPLSRDRDRFRSPRDRDRFRSSLFDLSSLLFFPSSFSAFSLSSLFLVSVPRSGSLSFA